MTAGSSEGAESHHSRPRTPALCPSSVRPASVNALPAKAANHGSSCGYAVAGWSWRWRCGPVAWPGHPDEPDRLARAKRDAVAARRAPGTTCGSTSSRGRRAPRMVKPMPQRAVGPVPGVDDDAVRERVHRARLRAPRCRRPDSRGGCAPTETTDGPAADREDVVALVRRRGEEARRRPAAERRRLRRSPGALASSACAAVELRSSVRDRRCSCGVAPARRPGTRCCASVERARRGAEPRRLRARSRRESPCER